MKHKSKLLAVLLAVAALLAVLSLTLVACGKDEEQTQTQLPPHEHSYTLVEAKAPTCTEDGNIQHYTCDCGKFFSMNKNEILEAAIVIPSTGHDKVTTSWESDGTSHWHKCNNCDAQLDIASHTPAVDWIIDGDYACGDMVTRHKDCAYCDYTLEEEYGKLPHKLDPTTKKCKVCQRNYFITGDTLYFGEYPQTKVEDDGSGLIATLTQMSGDRPVKGNSGNWTDYGYYIGKNTDSHGYDGTPTKEEYMWYIDLEYLGARYRGVYFTSYRAGFTSYSSSTGNTYQDDNGYYINTFYWFKWEPIEWRVLERTGGELFLMSNVILDSQHYYYEHKERTIDGKTVYPNNYKESDIRAWLNGTFYAWAFDMFEQAIIKETLVDNSVSTTGYSSNSYACEDTNDKVFLLSRKEVSNTKYGFDANIGGFDTARYLKPTGYAQSQGAYTSTDSDDIGNGDWWLRSPHIYDGNACCVNSTSSAFGNMRVNITTFGVVPAIKITL